MWDSNFNFLEPFFLSLGYGIRVYMFVRIIYKEYKGCALMAQVKTTLKKITHL